MLVDPELASRLKESSKKAINKAWNKKCEEAGKKHIAKVRGKKEIVQVRDYFYISWQRSHSTTGKAVGGRWGCLSVGSHPTPRTSGSRGGGGGW